MRRVTAPPDRIAVVGAGTTPLVGELAAVGFEVVALDVSSTAIAALRVQFEGVGSISYVVADVRTWHPPEQVATWHDRAVFHFLVDDDDQQAYAEAARRAVRIGGHLVIGTFAPDGPEQCSGLPVARHDAASLRTAFGGFEMIDSFESDHETPWGSPQRFTHAVLRRLN